MTTDTAPEVIYLKDYQAPSFNVESTELTFKLFETHSEVTAKLVLSWNPNRASSESAPLLELFGEQSLELTSIELNGQPLSNAEYQREAEVLSIPALPEHSVLLIKTKLYPAQNTALEGLYQSDGVYCTQCEAEGFRRITFFLDRPDVMSIYKTTIEADKAKYPVLLSNGNLIESEELTEGRHRAVWFDPHPKPSYLFALVAGDLKWIEDRYTTVSGRDVRLVIYAEEKDLDKLNHAMISLKSAMQWDEEVYGREYDLDIYMIVAVDFFNMGAMENKGLNVFNTSCVLAHQKTTTDMGFQRVEGVVAHEYFHNWSGNRVTCRDWFQLSLKEGFTVFRDAEFTADMNSRTVKRVEDVTLLRTAQFAEDAGPMAHPVRPASFIEISNFYTMTVYEKGAEVVRMLHTLLGADKFREGTDLYFERHDGQAVTTDDFVKAMEDVSGRDLTQFKRWYSQAGTPVISVTDSYDEQANRYQITVTQSCPETPDKLEKLPFHIPLRVALLNPHGEPLILENNQQEQVLELLEAEQSFQFEGVKEKPFLSFLRGFSAPVKLQHSLSREQLIFQIRYDNDGFSRWNAMQTLMVEVIQQLESAYLAKQALQLDEQIIELWKALLSESNHDYAMLAKLLTLPSEAYLSELAETIEVEAIHHARRFVRETLAQQLESEWLHIYRQHPPQSQYQPDAASIASRSLRNLALAYLVATESATNLELAEQQYRQADNMTDQQAALLLLAHSSDKPKAEAVLADFYQQWSHESLVVNQWLSVQATSPATDALEQVKSLIHHQAFNMNNPNKVRALISTFCGQNPIGFHRADGLGYEFLADHIILLNKSNPQIASRLLTPLTRWKRYSPERQTLMKAALKRVEASGNLSSDVYEVLSKSLI